MIYFQPKIQLKLQAEFLRKRYIQEKSFKSFKATSDVSELNCIGKKNIRRVKSLGRDQLQPKIEREREKAQFLF